MFHGGSIVALSAQLWACQMTACNLGLRMPHDTPVQLCYIVPLHTQRLSSSSSCCCCCCCEPVGQCDCDNPTMRYAHRLRLDKRSVDNNRLAW
jgi:hypothetical protein